MVCFAFACLLACEKSHFACLVFEPLSLSSLPLVSIGFRKYSTDCVQYDDVFGGGHWHALPWIPFSLHLISAPLHQPLRHQLPSQSIVDEFKVLLCTLCHVCRSLAEEPVY